jgi:hypothetical protein
MSAPARQKSHAITWDAEDWDGILRAAALLTERDHVERETTPTDVIRTGARRFVAEVIGSTIPLKAS